MDRLEKENNDKLHRKVLLLCEGKGDAGFFSALREQREIGEFQICFPNPETASGFGVSAFGQFLTALKLRHGYDDLEAIVCVIDNDNSPAKAIKDVKKLIQEAGLSAPTEALTFTDGRPSVAILPLPSLLGKGCIETLLEQSLTKKPKLKRCVRETQDCVSIKHWSVSKKSKAAVAIATAIYCRTDPRSSLAFIWGKKDNPFSLQHKCFDEVANFLRRTCQQFDV